MQNTLSKEQTLLERISLAEELMLGYQEQVIAAEERMNIWRETWHNLQDQLQDLRDQQASPTQDSQPEVSHTG